MKTLLAYYITGIAANEKFAARIERLTFLDLMKKLYDNDGDAVIPVLNAEEDELYSSYLNIIKDYRGIDQLERKEAVALKWLNNKVKGGVIQLNKNKGNLPFLYHSFKRTIHLDRVEEGKIYLVYKMETEGSIEENPLGETLLNEAILSKHEKDYEEIIETRSKKIIEKMQKEYQVDLLGVREFLYKYYPRLFESISDDFTEYFEKDILIDVEAKVRIRRIGKTK